MELMEDAAEEYPQLLPDFAHKEVEVASTIHRRQERRGTIRRALRRTGGLFGRRIGTGSAKNTLIELDNLILVVNGSVLVGLANITTFSIRAHQWSPIGFPGASLR